MSGRYFPENRLRPPQVLKECERRSCPLGALEFGPREREAAGCLEGSVPPAASMQPDRHTKDLPCAELQCSREIPAFRNIDSDVIAERREFVRGS